MSTNIAERFNARYSYFVEQGYRGAELFQKLASDSELPWILDLEDACLIEGLSPAAMRKRRSRGQGAGFKRNGRFLQITRPEYCMYLADRLAIAA